VISLRNYWIVWGKEYVTLAASFASILALLLVFLPPPKEWMWWMTALIVLTVVFLGFFIASEVRRHRGRYVYARSDSEGIRKYLHNWIEHGGRVAIWTRDMSWAQNRETHDLLIRKAKDSELILCLPKLSELARELKEAGAEVCAYGAERLESPESRFTITNFGIGGSRVAVGRPEQGIHVIDEFSADGQPAFHLAKDLIDLVRSFCGPTR
jgi:hypothetical protein